MTRALSRFMHKTLMEGEKIVSEAHIHGFYTFWALLQFSLWLLCGFGAQFVMARLFSVHAIEPVLTTGVLGAFFLFLSMLRKWTTEIVLTNNRLLYKRGFFMAEIDEVDIEQLASDNVQQSLIGRIFDYGSVHVRCIEAKDVVLTDIARPYEFRNAIEHQKHAYRERYMNIEHLRHHGPDVK